MGVDEYRGVPSESRSQSMGCSPYKEASQVHKSMGFPLQGSRAGPEVVSSCKRSKDAMGNQMHNFLLQAIQGLWEAQMDSPFPNGIHGLPTPFPNRFLQLDTPETGFQGCQEGAAEGAEGGSGPGGAREIFRVVGCLSPCKPPLQKLPGSLKDTHGPTWLLQGKAK